MTHVLPVFTTSCLCSVFLAVSQWCLLSCSDHPHWYQLFLKSLEDFSPLSLSLGPTAGHECPCQGFCFTVFPKSFQWAVGGRLCPMLTQERCAVAIVSHSAVQTELCAPWSPRSSPLGKSVHSEGAPASGPTNSSDSLRRDHISQNPSRAPDCGLRCPSHFPFEHCFFPAFSARVVMQQP